MTEEKKKKSEREEAISKLKERSKEISESLEKKVEIKDIKGIENELEKETIKKEVKDIAEKPEEPKEEKPKEPKKEILPPKTKKPKVKEIDKVEKEISREIEKQVEEKILPVPEAIKSAAEKSKKRKFTQTWDLVISLKGVNLKKPENRFNLEFMLPGGRGKDVKVAVIADTLVKEAKENKDVGLVISRGEIESIASNKKKLKRIANEYDWFYGEASLMPLIGKSFGVVLGPRGKVPKPIPPKVNIEPFVKRAKNMVRISLKDTPVIHVPVGAETTAEADVEKNIKSVYNFVKEKLPKGENNIRSVYIKLTMGRPVKVDIRGGGKA
jgi:large subunit ribosomal protein L1